jgi:imidazolonepropionase
VLERGDVLIDQGRIVRVAPTIEPPPGAALLEADARVLMPGFVDCHTHACFAGDRLDEWERRRRGEAYLEILRSGGGIMATVRATRGASQAELQSLLAQRLELMLRCGTTTVEVKSGYGLTTADEIRMLRAIKAAGEVWEGTVVPTALLGHALDPGQDRFVERVIAETLHEVSGEFPGISVDAYCEEGAWSPADCTALFEAARARGHPIRVHADQFHSLGMIPEAIRLGARSVDHLEASTPEHLGMLAGSGTFGVGLPACGFHLDGRYADLRHFVDAGGAPCIATNFNPGSAPCLSMPMVIALAVRHGGLSPAEAIAAATVNPAALLGLDDRGTIAPGQRADLILLRHHDERELAYEFGAAPIDAVICAGRVVYESAPRPV